MPAAARMILPEDILSDRDYARRRDELRKAAIARKQHRRVEVGPFATFYFENFETMWLQVMEMLRIEKGGQDQLAGELDTYNPLIPQGRELIATLMLEIADPGRRNGILKTLGGIEERAFMDIGATRVRASPTDYQDRTTADGKTSSVHWLRFRLDADQIARFTKDHVVIGFDHGKYGHMAVLDDEAKSALARDFL